MSHKLDARCARVRVSTPNRTNEGRSLIIKASDTAKYPMSEGLTKCSSPVCEVEFGPSGMAISPRVYCCDQCRKDVWVLKRAASLYGLSPQTMHEVLTKARGYIRQG